MMLENKELKIGKKTFKHNQVDMKVLNAMIEELSNLAPRETKANTTFQQLVGDFPNTTSAEF